jgi:hypothetical protein
LLTALAVAVVHRERPDWLAVGVGDAARAVGLSPERVSRLATRVLAPWQDVVATATRRGRPPAVRARDDDRRELVRLRALLAVATTILGLVSPDKPAVRDAVVGAWRRLSTELPSLTKTAFCAALALSERTLRHWLHAPRAAAPTSPPSSHPPSCGPRKRPPRRPRFTFDVFLAGNQVGGDTTNLSAFGVPLKLVGVQDIGGRAERLFESVVIDTRESSVHVIDAFRAVLRDCPGMQAITDQGTPYMAKETRAFFDELDAEHAPQKEGDPTGKSTVEKGFDSLKRVAEPLLALSGRLAELVPQLRSPDLAVPFARIVVSTVLRAYQAGSRAARRAFVAHGGGVDEATLVRAAARAREVARADDRSARLLLTHLHDLFLFNASRSAFVHRFRRYPIHVLRAAEAALRKRLLLDGAPAVRSADRYFAALVRSAFADHHARRIATDADRELDATLRRDERDTRERYRAHLDDPVCWLRDALDLLAMQWIPRERALLFGGDGLGLAWTRGALDALLTRSPVGSVDLVAGVLDDFRRAQRDSLGDDGSLAIARLVERELALARERHSSGALADEPERAIPPVFGRFSRSADPDPLRS